MRTCFHAVANAMAIDDQDEDTRVYLRPALSGEVNVGFHGER